MPTIWILRDSESLMFRKSSDANQNKQWLATKVLFLIASQSKTSLWQNDCQIVTWSERVTLIGHMAQSYYLDLQTLLSGCKFWQFHIIFEFKMNIGSQTSVSFQKKVSRLNIWHHTWFFLLFYNYITKMAGNLRPFTLLISHCLQWGFLHPFSQCHLLVVEEYNFLRNFFWQRKKSVPFQTVGKVCLWYVKKLLKMFSYQ